VKTKLPGRVLRHQHEGQRGDQPKYQKCDPYKASDVPLGAWDDVKLLSLRLGHGNPLYRYLDTDGVQLQDCESKVG
jgi:hypothetical protein